MICSAKSVGLKLTVKLYVHSAVASRATKLSLVASSSARAVNTILSAVQYSRTLDVQYKTAWVLCHKLRECLADETDDITLEGEVEIDGCYVGGYIRPANEKADRVDRRRKENQTGERRVVIALRERFGRTIPFVRKLESEGVEIARGIVDEDATIFADEGPHWDLLEHDFKTGRVNHSTEYSLLNGKHTNWVESYFARLRKMVKGQHHGVSPIGLVVESKIIRGDGREIFGRDTRKSPAFAT